MPRAAIVQTSVAPPLPTPATSRAYPGFTELHATLLGPPGERR
jgi:hypothetical protein